MRRAAVIATLSALALALPAVAETWTAYTTPTDKGIQWSYDSDYSYRDAASGRVVGRPRASIAQLSGMGSPRSAAK